MLCAAIACGAAVASPQLEMRPLKLRDLAAVVEIGDPQAIPGNRGIVYERRVIDARADAFLSSIWWIDVEGSERLLADGASGPRPSPDGETIAFRRDGQPWLLSLGGGDAWQLATVPQPVEEMAWSPDGSKLVLVLRDPAAPAPDAWPDDSPSPLAAVGTVFEEDSDFVWVPAEAEAPEPQQVAASAAVLWPLEPDVAPPDAGRPLPRVLRRYDVGGGVAIEDGPWRRHLWVVTAAGREAGPATPARVTRGPWNDVDPGWSPDGDHVVFLSDRPRADACGCASAWSVPAAGGEPSLLLDDGGAVGALRWSPDGAWLAYVGEADEAGRRAPRLRLRPVRDGLQLGEPIDLAAGLDRPFASSPAWAADGSALYVTLADRGTVVLVRVSTGVGRAAETRGRRRRGAAEAAGHVQAVIAGPRAVHGFALPGDGTSVIAAISDATDPAELYRAPLAAIADVEVPSMSPTAHLQGRAQPVAAALRRLSAANVEWRQQVQLAAPEPLRLAVTADVFVEGWLYRPPVSGTLDALPLIVLLPSSVRRPADWSFSWQAHWLAAQGYAVMLLNARGSSGDGGDFGAAGDQAVADIVAGVAHLVQRGIARADAIGILGDAEDLAEALLQRLDGVAAAVIGPVQDPHLPSASRKAPTLLLASAESPALQRLLSAAPATDFGIIVYAYGVAGDRPSYLADRWLRTKAWFDRHLLGDVGADPFFGEWSR